MTGAGLVLLIGAMALAAGPFQQTNEFRAVVACGDGDGCPAGAPGLVEETGVVRDRQQKAQLPAVDANGLPVPLPDLYELTWERPGGARETRKVSVYTHFYARVGDPVTIRRWRDHTVGVEIAGHSESFTPPLGNRLRVWSVVAWVGAVIAAVGVFADRRPGFLALFGGGLALVAALLGPPLLAFGWDGTDHRVIAVFVAMTAILSWSGATLLKG
jgi:hypothetical protein